ncbi:MAG TPA: TIGR03085 family metal-binding protein [Dermatophilaceae bacterium]|nr:TIGR03085 family metal-binding protein [Dermatophilaceae bacterium]
MTADSTADSTAAPAPSHLARVERLALCDAFDRVGPDAPTLCEGWATRDLAAHLVVRERRPDLAVGILLPPLAGRLERAQRDLSQQPWAELVEVVRAGPPAWSPTRLGRVDDLVNTIEMVVHHEDVLRGDGTPGPRRELPADLDRAVWKAVRQSARLMFRRADVGVVLTAPGRGTVTARARAGEPTVVLTGAPLELLLTAYGRGQAADVTREGDPAAIERLAATRLGMA